MNESPRHKSFDIRLLTLPDRMHVIDNMDVNTRAPLPSMQLWEVEESPGGPVVIEAPSGEARIFMTESGTGWTLGKLFFKGSQCRFRCLRRNGLVSFPWTSISVRSRAAKAN